jgi:lipoate-protein ligase B
VSTDLDFFDLIVPCGIEGVTMTSIARELGSSAQPNLMTATRDAVTTAFGRVFDRRPRPAREDEWNLTTPAGEVTR